MNVIDHSDETHIRVITNTLPKVKNCAQYNDLHLLPRMGYSTRDKQRNSEKNETYRNSKQKPTTMSKHKMGFDNEQQHNNR